jgi:hypothetical protein
MKFAWLAAATLLIHIAGSEHALASEWRFCIAPFSQEQKIYVTAPFSTGAAMEAVETGFRRLLERAGHRHDSVQCPMAPNETAIRAMREHADDFNRQLGIAVLPIDWKPPAGR